MSSDASAPQPLHRIPAALTPLVGRAEERSATVAALRDPATRLLTITGAGGIGKTRLALAAAAELAPEADPSTPFAHGVALVSLASVAPTEPLEETLATTIAASLGLEIGGGQPAAAQLRAYLRGKQLLLVLDNVEMLIDAAAMLAELLAGAPGTKVLATSRERLQLSAERVFPLRGLPFPESGSDDLARYDAVQLFAQAAAAVSPGLTLDGPALAAAGQICRLVDGSPLGIELAAAWSRLLSPAEIAAEIARGPDFLEGGARDTPARHRSLRAVFDYSWSQLDEDERSALRRLSVFRGAFTLQAAGAVLGGERAAGAPSHATSLRLLASLADKSLLRRAQPSGSATRYELPEVIGQYAAEHLRHAGEADPAADQHAAHYLGQLAALRDALRGSEQQRALAEISADLDQVRAAWRRATAERSAELLHQASESMFHFYDMRSWFREGEAAFAAAAEAAAAAGAPVTWARLLARQGWFTFHLGRQSESRALLARSLDELRALGARDELPFPLSYLGVVSFYLGAYEETERLCGESLAITQAAGDRYGQAVACNILGQMAFEQGDMAAAREWCRRSLAIERQIGNAWSMAYSLTTLGKVASALGEHDEARRLLEESLRTREATRDVRGIALCLNRLGENALALGAPAEALGRFTRALALFRTIGNTWGEATTLDQIGRLAAAQGRIGPAARILQEALRLALETDSAPQAARVAASMAPLVRHAGDAGWAAALEHLDAAQLDGLRPHAERLLAWWPGAPELSLDHALQSLQEPAPQPSQPAPAARPTYPAGLTAREVEVLRLVAQGLTDAQVAEKLVVSPRTVSTHLTSIYGKLQVSSRTAAARLAIEHSIV